MLEFQRLLLRPWVSSVGPYPGRDREETVTIRTRTIDAADTGNTLGFACWRPGTTSAWLRWFTRSVLEVYETADVSLLFTVHRCWSLSPKWEVRDAEEKRVGWFRDLDVRFLPLPSKHRLRDASGKPVQNFRGVLVADRLGQTFAWIQRVPDGSSGQIVSLNGGELGVLRPSEAGLRVTFTSELEDNPFIKMVLLAALLGTEE